MVESLVMALLLWLGVFFARSTLLKQIPDQPATFWILPVIELFTIYFFIQGFSQNIEFHLRQDTLSQEEGQPVYLYQHWFFQVILIGLIAFVATYFSIIFWNQDLIFTQYWAQQAAQNPRLDAFGDFADRSIFDGEGFGVQDLPNILVVLAVLLYFISYIPALEPKLAPYRKYFAFIIVSAVVLGIVNRGFKAFFGRVRPGSANQFDADYGAILPYTPMWTFGGYDLHDAFSTGSFTSGHTTTATIILVLGYISIRTHKSGVIATTFALAIAWAVMAGFGRVVHGSHYPGDVLWAIIIGLMGIHWVYFYVLRIPEQEAGTFTITKKFAELSWSILFVFFGVFILLGLLGIKYTLLDFKWYWAVAIGAGPLLAWGTWKLMQKVLQ